MMPTRAAVVPEGAQTRGAARAALRELADRRLRSLAERRPELAGAMDAQGALLRETLEGERAPIVRGFGLTPERARAKLEAGIPLLHNEPVFVDLDCAADAFARLLNVAAERAEVPARQRIEDVATAAVEGRLEAGQVLGEAFVEHRDHLWQIAAASGIDADVLSNLAVLAVKPLLVAYGVQLAARPGCASGEPWAGWRRGYCPVCGTWPILVELCQPGPRKTLRCGGCGSGWPAAAAACPFCGTSAAHRLRTIGVEGERRYTAQACEACRGYVKLSRTMDPTPPELLPLDDLASLSLDVAAMEAGFQRPTTAGFTLELAIPEEDWEAE